VDADDVGVIELADGACLAHQLADLLLVVGRILELKQAGTSGQ
jgi:hypothetical protein